MFKQKNLTYVMVAIFAILLMMSALVGFQPKTAYANHPFPPQSVCNSPPNDPIARNCARLRELVNRTCHGSVSAEMINLCTEFPKNTRDRNVSAIFSACSPEISGDALSMCRHVGYNDGNDTVVGPEGTVSRTGEGSTTARFEGDCDERPLTKDTCAIIGIIVLISQVLSGIVGIIIVIMFAVGGIQYSMSRDKPELVAAAKGHLTNTVMALLFYLFTMAFLQWVIPGGLLQ